MGFQPVHSTVIKSDVASTRSRSLEVSVSAAGRSPKFRIHRARLISRGSPGQISGWYDHLVRSSVRILN